MAECLLTSVGGCLGLWGRLWPGWLNPHNWSGHRAVKPMTEEQSVPEDPSGLRRIGFAMLSIAQLSGKKFVNWAVRTPASHFPFPAAWPRTHVLFHISCCCMHWSLSISLALAEGRCLDYHNIDTAAPQKDKTSSRHSFPHVFFTRTHSQLVGVCTPAQHPECSESLHALWSYIFVSIIHGIWESLSSINIWQIMVHKSLFAVLLCLEQFSGNELD